MNRKIFLILLGIFITIPAHAGQVQISTYYPSPFGYYERLKFNPRTSLTEPCEPGTVYYLSGTGLKYCAEDTLWKNMGGGVWTQSGDNVYPINYTNPNLKVLVGPDALTASEFGDLNIKNLNVSPQIGLRVSKGGGSSIGVRIGSNLDIDTVIQADLTKDNLELGTGGVERVHIDGTTGNVGIGTASPGGKFHISGAQDESSSGFGTTGIAQRLSATNNGVEAGWFAGLSGGLNRATFGTMSAHDLGFVVGGATRMTIVGQGVNVGNVGVGMITPTAILTSQAPTVGDVNTVLRGYNNTATSYIDLNIQPDGTANLGGTFSNFGIGTTAPAQKLDVVGQIHASGDICTDTGGGVCLSSGGGGGSGTVDWVNVTNKPAGFADNIDNIGIGAEIDPTVLASVKDGVAWPEIAGIPPGFADNIDNVGASVTKSPAVYQCPAEGTEKCGYKPWCNGQLATYSTCYNGAACGSGDYWSTTTTCTFAGYLVQ